MSIKVKKRSTGQFTSILYVIFLTLISVACADIVETRSSNTSKSFGGFGASEYIYYSCETATNTEAK